MNSFCISSVYDRSVYIGAGYESFFPKSNVLSDFADRQNNQRASILIKKMEAPIMLRVFSFTGGMALGPLLMELSFSKQKGMITAQSSPSLTQGGATGREINFENKVLNITFGVLIADEETESYILFQTIEANFMSLDFTLKLTGISNSDTKWEAGSANQLGLEGVLMKGTGSIFIL